MCGCIIIQSIFVPLYLFTQSFSRTNSISDKFAIICLIKHGEHVAEQATKTNPPQLHICMFFINQSQQMAFIFPPHGSACLQCKHMENLGFTRPLCINFPLAYVFQSIFLCGALLCKVCNWTRKCLRNILNSLMSGNQRDMKLWHQNRISLQ